MPATALKRSSTSASEPCSGPSSAHRRARPRLKLLKEPVDGAALPGLVLEGLTDDTAGEVGRQAADLSAELGERLLAVGLDLNVRGLDETAGLGLRLLAELGLDLRALLTSLFTETDAS